VSYHGLLTRKYLTSKVMPLLAAMAVTLCVATVLVVWSVMGGFLKNLIETGRTLSGDVSIRWPTAGFARYRDLVERLEAHEAVEAASPMIETFGMLQLPDGRSTSVILKGVEPESFSRVSNYEETIWWRPIDEPLAKDTKREDPRLPNKFLRGGGILPEGALAQIAEEGRLLQERDPETGELGPAMALGIEVGGFNIRLDSGVYALGQRQRILPDGREFTVIGFLPDEELVIGLPVFDRSGAPYDFRRRRLPVANEFSSGMYMNDKNWVLMPLGELQRLNNMDEVRAVEQGDPFEVIVDPETGEERFAEPEVTGVSPARVTTVILKAAPGVEANALAKASREIYTEFELAHEGEVPPAQAIRIETWEDENSLFIGAIKKEIVLVMFIFGIVSLTSVFLVLAIFWAMISEKTKDIGILRALGASRAGIAWLWLRYGLAIGVVGAVLGGLLAWLIVSKINWIHDKLIELGQRFDQNWAVFDPQVYIFTEIPTDLELTKALVIMGGGALASVLGALYPALRAARMNPVKSLRFE
jgi:lipoprotein-releasing system permease protein